MNNSRKAYYHWLSGKRHTTHNVQQIHWVVHIQPFQWNSRTFSWARKRKTPFNYQELLSSLNLATLRSREGGIGYF